MKKSLTASALLAMAIHGHAATYDVTSSFQNIQQLTTQGSPTSSYAEWTFGYTDLRKYDFVPYSFFNGHRTSEGGYVSDFTWALSAPMSAGAPPMAWIYEGEIDFQAIKPGTLVLQPARPTLSYTPDQGELKILDQRSSAVRFTAPNSSTYSIEAIASSLDSNQKFLVVTSNIAEPLIDRLIESNGTEFSLSVFLQQGQTVDFIGASTLATGDNTYIPISITITSVPEPSSLWAAVSGIFVIGAYIKNRRHPVSKKCLHGPA